MISALLLLASILQAQPADQTNVAAVPAQVVQAAPTRRPATLRVPRRIVGHWAANFPPIVEPCRGKYADDYKWSLFISKDKIKRWEETAWPTKIREVAPGKYLIDFYAVEADEPFTYRETYTLSEGDRTLTIDQPVQNTDIKERRFRRCLK